MPRTTRIDFKSLARCKQMNLIMKIAAKYVFGSLVLIQSPKLECSRTKHDLSCEVPVIKHVWAISKFFAYPYTLLYGPIQSWPPHPSKTAEVTSPSMFEHMLYIFIINGQESTNQANHATCEHRNKHVIHAKRVTSSWSSAKLGMFRLKPTWRCIPVQHSQQNCKTHLNLLIVPIPNIFEDI